MIYVTFEKYTNRKGKIGTANRVFSSKSKAEKYATNRGCELKAHRGSWVA